MSIINVINYMSILMLLMIYEMLHVILLQILTNYYTL